MRGVIGSGADTSPAPDPLPCARSNLTPSRAGPCGRGAPLGQPGAPRATPAGAASAERRRERMSAPAKGMGSAASLISSPTRSTPRGGMALPARRWALPPRGRLCGVRQARRAVVPRSGTKADRPERFARGPCRSVREGLVSPPSPTRFARGFGVARKARGTQPLTACRAEAPGEGGGPSRTRAARPAAPRALGQRAEAEKLGKVLATRLGTLRIRCVCPARSEPPACAAGSVRLG